MVVFTRHRKWKFCLEVGQGDYIHLVGKLGFCRTYSGCYWYVEDKIQRLMRSQEPVLNRCAEFPASVTKDSRLSFAETFGIHLTPFNIGNVLMGQSLPAQVGAAWMRYYYSLSVIRFPNLFIDQPGTSPQEMCLGGEYDQ